MIHEQLCVHVVELGGPTEPDDPDCVLCEQEAKVDSDGICQHCRERLNGLGYYKNEQALGMVEKLGELRGLIKHLAGKCDELTQ